MAGLYIHIPYCHQACTYCDFHFSVNQASRPELVNMLARELDLYREEWPDAFGTVYLGGGTPGILLPDELAFLMDSIRSMQGIADGAEITIEANPDDVVPDKLRAWKDAGINRISLGIQALDDPLLKWMNRTHCAADALAALQNLSAAGFSNINADLIYGLPGVTDEQLYSWIHTFRDAGVKHISAYALTVEPKTVLARQVSRGETRLPEDEIVGRQYLLSRQYLVEDGFEQYELSNYAVPGFESQHNAAYWSGVPYLGLGPSANSYDGRRRWWNVRSNAQYIRLIGEGLRAVEGEEILTMRDRYHEYIMTGLRKTSGIETRNAVMLSDGEFNLFVPLIQRWKESGLLHMEENRLWLTPQGMLLSDHLISQLFLDNEEA